ncbi:MAG: energy-coupling factor ABC transporter permease [Kiritimatiellaeota bacterium]|nr:energy-coupling factor ABC transporter permease [Kiritimatiellota bacterium]
MHISDGFLDTKTALATGALALAGLGLALRRVRQSLPTQRIPLLGLAAAFIFAAQMLNFPVAGGTSGHLIGGALAAVLLGPAAAVVAMSAVLVLQCLLFSDGGVTALGANLFNMAIVAPVVAWLVYRPLTRVANRRCAVALAAWASTLVAALLCAGELAWSGRVAWRLVFPAMGGVHALIGIGEALITTLVLGAIIAARPELLETNAPTPRREVIGFGLLLALGLVLFIVPFACPWPDGLEKVAAQLGFELHSAPVFKAPRADYAVPGLKWDKLGTILSGVIGTLAAFVLAWSVVRLIGKKKTGP